MRALKAISVINERGKQQPEWEEKMRQALDEEQTLKRNPFKNDETKAVAANKYGKLTSGRHWTCGLSGQSLLTASCIHVGISRAEGDGNFRLMCALNPGQGRQRSRRAVSRGDTLGSPRPGGCPGSVTGLT